MNPDLESELAKVQVQDASDREVVSLAYRSESIVEAFPDRLPNQREIEEMSLAFGPELVQMALLRILGRISPNRYFYEQVEATLRDSPDLKPSSMLWLNKREPPVLSPRDLAHRYELCIVASVDPASPGAEWGAHVREWQHWARLSGMTTDVIQTKKGQSLLSNAETIRKFLAENPHDRRIIATLGQGGTEMRLLIDHLSRTESLDEFEGVRAWLNVSGIIHGASGLSKMRESKWNQKADSVKQFFRGWPASISAQLSSENMRLRQELDWKTIPFVCVSLVGFPNVGDVAVGHKGQFMNLVRRSPNDGVCLFHEAIVKPGYIIPVPHMSHRAEAMRLAPWFMATVRSLKAGSRADQSPFMKA